MLSSLLLLVGGFLMTASEAISQPAPPAELPHGYKLVYEQDFAEAKALSAFRFTDPRAWRWQQRDGNGVLEMHARSEYAPPHRSPHNMAMLSTLQFESFVLEADLLQTGKEYGHRDMCIYFGFLDPAHYYYVHLASKADKYAHNIFIVNDGPRAGIESVRSEGVEWGDDQWHRIRVVRNATDGLVEMFFDDMTQPIMTGATDRFGLGYIGFGSFDDTGLIDNVRVWAPKAVNRRAHKLFAHKPLNQREPEPDVRADGFQPLFDGRTLDGWRLAKGPASGKMQYAVEDRAVVGKCVLGQPNGFLRTDEEFEDFIFTCEVRFDVLGNSGIQFRSRQREENGRVYGYQCEIDGNPNRRYSGGIYDEARRGWLFPLWGAANEEARQAFQYDEWNRFTIQARGRRLQTWVNGVPCADYTDTDPDHFTPSGFIALQVHSGLKGQIRWRNLKLKALDRSDNAAGTETRATR